jgi:plasmid maintenance system killer protein
VIRSFRDKITEAVFNGESPKGFPANLVEVARRKLALFERRRRSQGLEVASR